jgi:hypothetical protein
VSRPQPGHRPRGSECPFRGRRVRCAVANKAMWRPKDGLGGPVKARNFSGFVALALLLLWTAPPAGASVASNTKPNGVIAHNAASGYTWGNADEVPYSGTLNAGGFAYVSSISCTSAGNCSAGGAYTDGSGHTQALVVEETDGTWGSGEEVPDSGTLNAGGYATIGPISCTSAGNCSAGGFYTDGSGYHQTFVVDQTNGTWGSAEEVPYSAALNAGGYAYVSSVSCTSAGNCGAGGTYKDGSGNYQAFIVDETDGTWGNAEEVPNSATLNAGGYGYVSSVSCTSAGNCGAGGAYTDGSGHDQGFVVDEIGGTWGNAEEVGGLAPYAAVGSSVSSISCTSSGNCSAGGSYEDGSGDGQAYVVNEIDGTWGNAEQVPGTATLNTGGSAYLFTVACSSGGNCSAGGGYTDSSGRNQVFVVDEIDGTWGDAEEVPRTATLNAGGEAEPFSVSCASAGNCSAGGFYKDASHHSQAFVADETNGTWGGAEEVPGTAALNAGGDASISSISCTSSGTCSAGGQYASGPEDYQALVVNYGPPVPTVAGLSPASGPIKGGTVVIVYGTYLSGASAVHFGADAGTKVTVVNDDELKVSAPAGKGAVNVTVTALGGTSVDSSKDRYSYDPQPTVNGVAPRSGPTSAGAPVTVYGVNFVEPISVRFGTDPGTNVTIVNSGELKVTAPVGAGTVNVTVTTPGGASPISSNDRYSYFALPIVNGLSPTIGRPSGGAVVMVYGVNLGGTTTVRFGSNAGAHIALVNSGELKVTAPAGAGTVNVTVTTPGGTSATSSGDRYTYS